MTIRKYNGFESDTTVLGGEGFTFSGTWGNPTIATSPVHQTSTGYGGAKSLRMSIDQSVTIPATGVASADEIQVKVHRASSACALHILFLTSGTANLCISFDTDGYLRIRRGDQFWGTVICTSATTLAFNVWHVLKIRLTARETGRCEVFVNGSSTAFLDTGASVDCRATSTDDFTAIRFIVATPSGVNVHLDDFVHASNGTIPDESLYCLMLRPTGDGGTVQSTQSTGATRYGTVDEDPVSTSDYNELATAGHEDHLSLANLPATPTAVLAVRTVVHATGEGTITQLRGLVESGSTTAYGTNQSLTSGGSYITISDIFETDPNTSSAWTGTTVNAMLAGYEAN